MAWWNKVLSAAKSAVNKAKAAVKKVVTTIKKKISSTINNVRKKTRQVVRSVKKKVRTKVKKVKTSVKRVSNTIKKTISKKVNTAVDKVAGVVEDIKEKVRVSVEKVKAVTEKVKEIVKEKIKEDIKKVRRKTWPRMPVDLPDKLKPYWRRMEKAWVDNDKNAMIRVLRQLVPMTASPMPALAVILGIVGIVGLLVTIIGSYTFAGFIREEALQTIDFAIRTATFEKDIEGLEKAIAFKKELLERTLWEKIQGAIPIWTLRVELQDYYKASAIKLDIDETLFEKLKMEVTGEGMPEKIKAIIRDIIDGDTIDISLEAINAITNEEIRLPEYKTTGHARVRIVGINAPEKSPKGEILCTDIEIFKVEKEFADKSRDALLPLNDKEVILKIDPEHLVGTFGRILAVVEYAGVDIGLRQIKEGLACHYFREENKYVDDDLYSEATLDAKDAGTGMWAGLEEIEKEEDKVKIIITSTPDNARLLLDDVALHHNTPSDERELSDVIHLFTLGDHVLSAEKGGLSAMVDIEIVKGDNGTIHLDLETAPFPEEPTEEEIKEEELEEELEEEEVEEEKIIEPVKPAEIPKEYTIEQEWALKEAFDKILVLTEGKEIMSEKERENLISSFDLYTTIQKVVLDLLWRDLTYHTQGVAQLSADEYIALKEKYRLL